MKYVDAAQKSRGFTLIEIAVSIVVLGLLAIPIFKLYESHLKQQSVTLTSENVAKAVGFIQEYRESTGAYPCPARMTVASSSADYGRAVDCSAAPYNPATLTPGNCTADGICMEQAVAARIAAEPDVAANPHVIVGTIPYRDLQLSEDNSVDGYGSRLVYAVTYSLTNRATFDDAIGAISVVDANGNTRVVPEGSADYVILSPGESRQGAYTRDGALVSNCFGLSVDVENCNVGFDLGATVNDESIYVSAEKSFSDGANFFDDVIEYSYQNPLSPWKRTAADPENIETIAFDDVGIGTNTPGATLDITSTGVGAPPALRVSGPSGNDGAILTDQLCDENGNCFSPAVIVGDNSANPADGTMGEGMKCPAGEYMVGIEDGAAVCETVVEVTCPPATPVMRGIKPDGTPLCSAKPGASCGPDTMTQCSSHATKKTVSVSDGGGNAGDGYRTGWIYAGDCRRQRYQCDAGTWKKYGSGYGTCVDKGASDTYPACTSAKGYAAGSKTNYQLRKASSCVTGVNTLKKDCACVPIPRGSKSCGSCPSGYAATGPIPTYKQVQFCHWAAKKYWWYNRHNYSYTPVDTDGKASSVSKVCPPKSSYCNCVVPAVTTRLVNISCSDTTNMQPHPVDGYKKEQTFNASTCKWEDTKPKKIVGSCVCKSGNVAKTTTTACPSCDEVSSKGTNYYARHPTTCKATGAPLPSSIPAVCVEKKYFWDEIGTSTGDVTKISRKVGNACNCKTDIPGDKLCKKSGSPTVFTCGCKPL